MSENERSTPTLDEATRRAVLVGQNIGINSLLFVALGVYLVIDSGAWQGYAIALLAAEALIGGFWAANLIRHGKPTQGGWVMLVSDLIAPALASLTVVNLGYVAIAYILVSAYFIIAFAIAGNQKRMAMVLTAFSLVFPIFSLVFNPVWQLESSLVLTLAPIFTAVLGAVLLVVIVRQAWGSSMRNKLLVAFIGVTVVATGVLAVYVYNSTSNILQVSLENQLTEHTQATAVRVGDVFNEQINTLTALSISEILQQSVRDANAEYASDSADIKAALDEKDAVWRAADAANDNNIPLVHEHLTNATALELHEFQQAFPENIEIFITDVYGGLVGTTNRTSDYYQADEGWWQAAYNSGQGAVYISDPELDESAGEIGVQIALPLRNRITGEVVGILRTTYLVSALTTILDETIGQTGETDLFIPGEVVSHFHSGQYEPFEMEEFEKIQAVASLGIVEMDYEGVPSVVVQFPVHTLEGNPAVDNLGWVVVFHQHLDEAFAPLNAEVRGVLVVVAIVVVLAAAAAFGLSLILVRPITKLTRTAEEIAGGAIDTRAEVVSDDEVGTLATAFNTMTSRLREFIGTLEQRVAERTKDLATVADISTVTSTIQDPSQMLERMVHLTQRGFNRYHAHVFIYNKDEDSLEIVACGWEEGSEHEGTHGLTAIPLSAEQSLVALAARNREPVIVNDVRNEPGWLPNPQLPETRSEMAVPMVVGDKLLGVLDVQESRVDGFTEEDANIKMTLASQIAVALQNARTYAEAEQTRQEAQSLVDYAAEGIAIIDVESVTWTAPNEQFAQVFGMTRDEIVRTGPLQLSPPKQPDGRDSAEKAEELIGKALNEGPQEFEWVHLNASGEQMDCEIHLVALPGDKPRIRQSIIDITERKRQAEETARRARHEAALNLISQKIQNAATIEEAMQITARELGHALGKRQTLVALDPAALAADGGRKVVDEKA